MTCATVGPLLRVSQSIMFIDLFVCGIFLPLVQFMLGEDLFPCDLEQCERSTTALALWHHSARWFYFCLRSFLHWTNAMLFKLLLKKDTNESCLKQQNIVCWISIFACTPSWLCMKEEDIWINVFMQLSNDLDLMMSQNYSLLHLISKVISFGCCVGNMYL